MVSEKGTTLKFQNYSYLKVKLHSHCKKDAEVELYSSLNRLNNYEELIPIQQEILLSAEEDLKLAEQKYELGSADILELLDAQLAVIQASSSLLQLSMMLRFKWQH